MLNNYDDIKNEYGYIRQKNLLQYEKKKNDIYDKYQELKKMDFDIIDAYINLAKGNEVDIDKLKKIRLEFLKANNISDDYLKLKYTCNKCKDTGFIYGKKCSCYIEKEIEVFDKISHFKDYIKKDNFENLDESFYNQNVKMSEGSYKDYMKRVILHIKEQVNNIDKKPYNVIFIGATGTGKTFLARAIGAEFLKRNKSVLYVNVNEYLNSLKPEYEGEPLEKYAIIADLFIIDDLGCENQSEFTNTKLNYIIDKRLADGKSTIITTNCIPQELKQRYLESMVSRIMCMYQKYQLQGDDLRRIKYANV